ACAGCHPEGRDDGHVWHEIVGEEQVVPGGYRAGTVHVGQATAAGHPRQTPMLAGRVAAAGPYGWHGKSDTLEARLRVGFALHRWSGQLEDRYQVAMNRPKLIAAFLRDGLVVPSSEQRDLTSEEARGKAVFEDSKAGCATCHDPPHGFTDRSIVSLNR